jgi:hypothetical protein
MVALGKMSLDSTGTLRVLQRTSGTTALRPSLATTHGLRDESASSQPRALVVEVERLLTMDVADQLADAGFEIVGPATSVESALNLLDEQRCDVAVLDVHLGAGDSEVVALAQVEGNPFRYSIWECREAFPTRILRCAIPFETNNAFNASCSLTHSHRLSHASASASRVRAVMLC